MNMRNTKDLKLTKGSTYTGLSQTLSLFKVSAKHSAFRSWYKKLKVSDQRPRGKFFMSSRAITLRSLEVITLEDPIEFVLDHKVDLNAQPLTWILE